MHRCRRVGNRHGTTAALRFVGRVDGQGAQVGLRELPSDHPLAQGAGTDNRVAIHSDRYQRQPLLIQDRAPVKSPPPRCWMTLRIVG